MKEYNINTLVRVVRENELTAEDKALITEAIHAAEGSYSPYSHFAVGAALLLASGETVTGSNQENASYPAGCCAERTALYWTGANHKGESIKAMAVAARNGGTLTEVPVSPCGICRQVLSETEQRQGTPIRLLLYSTKDIYVVDSVASLFPLSFSSETMKI